MRHLNYILGILIAITLLSNSGCNNDDDLAMTDEQSQIALLASVWSPAEGPFVTLDDQDVSTNFQGFSLAFNTDRSYTSTSGNTPIWPESGTYEFGIINGKKNLSRMIRSDETVIDIIALTESTLRIEFYYDAANSGGRAEGVQGKYIFNLVTE